MTAFPHTVGRDRPLSEAHQIMREHGIRHLPVLDGGRLVGLVSMRDLHFIETLQGVDPAKVLVEEAMSVEPYVVRPHTALSRVARVMARRKLGSAVVMERGRVVGVFTTTDAMRALSVVLAATSSRPASRA